MIEYSYKTMLKPSLEKWEPEIVDYKVTSQQNSLSLEWNLSDSGLTTKLTISPVEENSDFFYSETGSSNESPPDAHNLLSKQLKNF